MYYSTVCLVFVLILFIPLNKNQMNNVRLSYKSQGSRIIVGVCHFLRLEKPTA